MSDYDAVDFPEETLWVYPNLVQARYYSPIRPMTWLPEGVLPDKENHMWSRGWNLKPALWVNTGITRPTGQIDIIEPTK